MGSTEEEATQGCEERATLPLLHTVGIKEEGLPWSAAQPVKQGLEGGLQQCFELGCIGICH